MRAGIRDRLSLMIPSIDGRVVEAHEASATLDKPYILLIQGNEATDTDWTGFRLPFECWPSVSQQADFGEADALAEQIVAALKEQTLVDAVSGKAFTCQYDGNSGSDKVDADRDVLTRGLRFSLIGVRDAEETEQDDWLAALCNWTLEALADADWQAYGGKWPSNYTHPSVLWRWDGVETIANARASTVEVRKKAVGHVLGRTPNEQAMTVAALAKQLSAAVKIPLSLPDRRYLTVLSPNVDLTQDAMTEGQIFVTLSRKVERYIEQGPLMREVHFQPKPKI